MLNAIELRSLSKAFGDCVANADISLRVRPGTIHAIVGENGAGKSTAMKMLYGIYPPDQGEILVNGTARRWKSPRDAIAAGIGMVHQHFMLAGPSTALENIVLGAEPGGPPWLPRALRPMALQKARRELERLAKQYGLGVNLDAPIESLPVGVQQRVEILKALYRNASILILDEPTAVLTPQEIEGLFANFRKLRDEGKTILIITHKLAEVMELSSEVTIFRAGRVVGECETAKTNPQELANLMVGRSVNLHAVAPPESTAGAPVLELKDLTLPPLPGRSRPRLDRVSFQVRAGEIVGIAGVEGNGQQELLDTVIRPQEGIGERIGSLSYFGAPVSGADNTADLRAAGMAVVPADRQREALLLEFPLIDNFVLGFQRDSRFQKRGLVSGAQVHQAAKRGIEEFDVRPRDAGVLAGRLSGGNQQKFIFARELSRPIRLLIAAQPTRGVDVGAIEFIHGRILAARASRVGVLLISSELHEVMALADRILVMYGGRVVKEIQRKPGVKLAAQGYDEQELGLWMGGGAH